MPGYASWLPQVQPVASYPGAGPKAGPAWGVTSLPPGMDLHDEHIVAAIERQQKR